MCLDSRAMRSHRAIKGWETRRRREAAEKRAAPRPYEVGFTVARSVTVPKALRPPS